MVVFTINHETARKEKWRASRTRIPGCSRTSQRISRIGFGFVENLGRAYNQRTPDFRPVSRWSLILKKRIERSFRTSPS